MPAEILGTEVERGPARWRAQTSGFDAEGPDDKTLVISFNGNRAKIPGFDGRSLNIAELREACTWARLDWIPATGIFRCSVGLRSITIAFS